MQSGKTLTEIQHEIGEWSSKNFGVQESINPLLGVGEEFGELLHATLKRRQAIRGFDDDKQYTDARDDAVADLLVYLCDYCCKENIDLLKVLNETWYKVSQRDWKANPENAAEVALDG